MMINAAENFKASNQLERLTHYFEGSIKLFKFVSN